MISSVSRLAKIDSKIDYDLFGFYNKIDSAFRIDFICSLKLFYFKFDFGQNQFYRINSTKIIFSRRIVFADMK
jgi:hypothetical protein